MSKEAITLDGVNIRPLDFTIEVLRRIPVPEGYTEKKICFLKFLAPKMANQKQWKWMRLLVRCRVGKRPLAT